MSDGTPSVEAVISAIEDRMADYITLMMKHDFEIDVALIKDPETEEISLENLDGSEVNEGQFYALAFFERGWFSALHAVGEIAETFEVDSDDKLRYTGENNTPGEETE